MASVRTYQWQALDTLWHVAARFLGESGYQDVSSFVDAIRAANHITDWSAVQPAAIATATTPAVPATIVTIPYTQ